MTSVFNTKLNQPFDVAFNSVSAKSIFDNSSDLDRYFSLYLCVDVWCNWSGSQTTNPNSN